MSLEVIKETPMMLMTVIHNRGRQIINKIVNERRNNKRKQKFDEIRLKDIRGKRT